MGEKALNRLAKIVNTLEGGISTADKLAAHTGVSVRQTYRDIAALKQIGLPIEGEPGFGYAMRLRKGVGLHHG
ncbi:MAG: HTH domain-containing protein [Mesorhizobium sp.]|uniref:HTH domain-containing protein n=1 Tax=Mesorhizobium sp. TaxID=1871066 RepID=UPI000FE96097|nr:HTH domain-containing protein [Mesorhizobium sp.]RWC91696.1 MAG: HTH domain-containing protein [Mesorhizobium sp.]